MQHENEILTALLPLSREQRITVCGIDGLGGAGKSTFAGELRTVLEAQDIHTILLHIDDFIHPRAVRYNDTVPAWQCYYDLQWRYDHFADVIRQARTQPDAPFSAELYDKNNDCYFSETYHPGGHCMILAEGIFLQRQELAGLFDYMIYIDIPASVRLKRVLRRDTYIGNEQEIREKYENRYFPAERHYTAAYHPAESAGLTISGSSAVRKEQTL